MPHFSLGFFLPTTVFDFFFLLPIRGVLDTGALSNMKEKVESDTKGAFVGDDAVPAYVQEEPESLHGETEQLDFWTRNGLNFNSFKRRSVGTVQLDRKMKPRHMHMIAIGGSIGAGFFVSSGSALSTGVRSP